MTRWRPLRIRPDGSLHFPTPDAGHVLVGTLRMEDGSDPMHSGLIIPGRQRAAQTVLAEVLAVGEGCRVSIGDRVLIQRQSGAGGIDPDRLTGYAADAAIEPYGGFHVVRCDLAIHAQRDGIDTALVTTATLVKGLQHLIRTDKAFSPDDPRGFAAQNDLIKFEALKAVIIRKRAGRAHNQAPAAAGMMTGEDGAVFDGVLAVVEG